MAAVVARRRDRSVLVPLSDRVGHDIPANRPELIGKLACRIHQCSRPDHILRELAAILERNGDA
jgi:hypothetical protein